MHSYMVRIIKETLMINVKVCGKINPIGIDEETPEFSWQLISQKQGVVQVSYQILVKDEFQRLVWNTGEVFSDQSIEILYEGSELNASTGYVAELRVVDNQGDIHKTMCSFETGLFLGNKMQSFGGGAQWIGADELTFDAASACYFDLSMEMKLEDGATAGGIVWGANDYRLKNANFNPWGIQSEVNYIRYDIDFTALKAGRENCAFLKIYVVGMPCFQPDAHWNMYNEKVPAYCIPIDNHLLNLENMYEAITISVDTLANLNQITCKINQKIVDASRQINVLGNTHDYNTFPNLNQIGFAVLPKQTVIFSKLKLTNPGQYSEGILFGENVGSGYEIFRKYNEVIFCQNKLKVTGQKTDKVSIICADPTYGSAPLLRSTLRLPDSVHKIKKARMYVSALGIYELFINGSPISDDWFNPGNSQYRERIGYHTYDLGPFLESGKNTIGVQLGEGWWSGYQSFIVHNYNYYGCKQGFMARILIEYTDGQKVDFVTNERDWYYNGDGPREYGSFFQGERYNAFKEIDTWLDSDFDYTQWKHASIISPRAEFSNYYLISRKDEPVKNVNIIQAKSVRKTSEHVDFDGKASYIYDMGENVIGVPEVIIPSGLLCSGTQVILRYAEVLYPDNQKEYQLAGITGMMMAENYRAALSTDFYTAKDDKAAVIMPRLTFHGYRYIEISGLSRPIPIENVRTKILSSIQLTGKFESSDALVNRLFKNIQNSHCSNFVSLPTDCPQRNERLGWTGDAQVFSLAATYNADVYEFYRQWLFTLCDEQKEDGSLPVIAPSFYQINGKADVLNANDFFCGITWDAAVVLIPYNMFLQYGKKSILVEAMPAIHRYLAYLRQNPLSVDGVIYEFLTEKTGFLADWLGIEMTDPTLINNAVYIGILNIAATIAHILGDEEREEQYNRVYLGAKRQWNLLYVNEDGLTIDPQGNIQDSQASYATPMRYNVFNDVYKDRAVEAYIDTIKRTITENGNYTVKTGFSGTPNLMPTLSENGFVEEAFRLFESKEYASWLYPVINGATSIWERWNSYTVEGGFNGNNSMNSFNHFSLGAILEWMMNYLLGIAADPNVPGFKHCILQPQFGGTFTYVKGLMKTPYGEIEVSWNAINGGRWETYMVSIPPNTYADIYLPIEIENETILAGEIEEKGVVEHNCLTCRQFKVFSGTYHFTQENDKIIGKCL